MGKIVKYCADCEEGFAEKFSFCPNCAKSLTAYEMNPASPGEVLKVAEPVDTTSEAPAETVQNLPLEIEPAKSAEPSAPSFLAKDDDLDLLDDSEFVSDETPASAETAAVTAPAIVSGATGGYNQSFGQPTDAFSSAYTTNGNGASNGYQSSESAFKTTVPTNRVKTDDGSYHITFVEEKNAKGRNMLLLGAFLLVTTTVLGGITYSLFKQNPYIGSLNDADLRVVLPDDSPVTVEEEKPEVIKKEKGGGGGGGGKENPEPASKGRQPTQVDNPIMPPQPLPQVTNASLPNPEETQGKIKRERTTEPVGLANGINTDNLSSGNGRGGGIGNGNGQGVGSGIGTGEGSGIGSGSGSGRGNGNGGGTGDGDGEPPKIAPKPPVIEAFKILSKPRANYTDTARQNQVTGVVRVRVVFLPSGAVGSVTPLNNLPYGLTEQAIAAAKQISFVPQKANGVPVSVTKVIEYSFSIY